MVIEIPGGTGGDRDTRSYWWRSRYQEVLAVIEIPDILVVIDIPRGTGGDRDPRRYWGRLRY